ncbi:MAG: hypothetical protein IJG35_00205 [Bacteroidales bacterium]|nr:hypothetical protein [Bacteroidales bacterium]
MKKREYQDIKTLDQLNEAIRHSRQRLESQGLTVRENLEQVQQFYTPQHVALSALQRFALDNHLYTIAINAVRGLKNLLKK